MKESHQQYVVICVRFERICLGVSDEFSSVEESCDLAITDITVAAR